MLGYTYIIELVLKIVLHNMGLWARPYCWTFVPLIFGLCAIFSYGLCAKSYITGLCAIHIIALCAILLNLCHVTEQCTFSIWFCQVVGLVLSLGQLRLSSSATYSTTYTLYYTVCRFFLYLLQGLCML